MSTQSRRLAVVAGMLVLALLAQIVPMINSTGSLSGDLGALAAAPVGQGDSADTEQAVDREFYMYIADTDGWRATADQMTVASWYDLRLHGAIAEFPRTVGDWRGEDEESNDTSELGFNVHQQVFRRYTDDSGRMLWLRLLATSDWQLYYHTPSICYASNVWQLEPESSYPVALDQSTLRMRSFVARQNGGNHLVLYSFLWPNRFKDMAEGATMVEVVVPFNDNEEQAYTMAEEFLNLIFTDNPALLQEDKLAMQHSVGANLEDQVTLLGYDLSADSVRVGEKLTVTLYWQAQRAMDKDYTIFVHVLNPPGDDPTKRVLAQKDGQPFDGMNPTSKWSVGQTLREEYELIIPEGATPGQRELEVGMYEVATGSRLNLVDANGQQVADSIMLSPVTITGP